MEAPNTETIRRTTRDRDLTDHRRRSTFRAAAATAITTAAAAVDTIRTSRKEWTGATEEDTAARLPPRGLTNFT